MRSLVFATLENRDIARTSRTTPYHRCSGSLNLQRAVVASLQQAHRRFTKTMLPADSPVQWHFRNGFPADGLPLSSEIGRFGHPEAVRQNAAHPPRWRFSRKGADRVFVGRSRGFDTSCPAPLRGCEYTSEFPARARSEHFVHENGESWFGSRDILASVRLSGRGRRPTTGVIPWPFARCGPWS